MYKHRDMEQLIDFLIIKFAINAIYMKSSIHLSASVIVIILTNTSTQLHKTVLFDVSFP